MGLTSVGAGQVVSRIGFFDDVLVDLRPLALRVAPKRQNWRHCGWNFHSDHMAEVGFGKTESEFLKTAPQSATRR